MAQFPDVNVLIKDNTNLPTEKKFTKFFGAQGITALGEIDKPVFISNWKEYQKYFGGYVAGSLFPKILKRALDGGAKGYIVRRGHYTDVADKTTLAGTKATITLTVSSDSAVFTAKAVGAGYNGITVKVSAAASGQANKVDILVTWVVTVQITPSETKTETFTSLVKNVSENPGATEKAQVNGKLMHVNIGTVTNKIPVGTVTLASGAQVIADIVDADYNGDQSQQTGWFAFDSQAKIVRFFNLDRPSPAVDIALKDYVESRGKSRFHIRTPMGIPIEEIQEYREGGGSTYTHVGINSLYGSIWAGDLIVDDPEYPNNPLTIPAIGDVCAAYAKKDTQGEWFSAARKESGRITGQDVLGVVKNFFNSSLRDLAAVAYETGVNFVIEHDNDEIGFTLWGNRSLFKDTEKVSSKENIADMMVFMKREMKAKIEMEHFQPNDPVSWRTIYSNVKPIIRTLEKGRAIIEGEGENWHWKVEQNIGKITDLTPDNVNNIADVQAGKYRVLFLFKPIASTEFVVFEIVPTHADVVINILN